MAPHAILFSYIVEHPMGGPIHVIIISWDSHYTQALQIAKSLNGVAHRLSVIYSNATNTPETGPGKWVRVPNEWYFGKKFRKSMELLAPGEVMLQIQADAHCDDWPALLQSCQSSLESHPNIGIWSPDITWTPWPSEVVGLDLLPNTSLLQIEQSDGIVWALTPEVIAGLRDLDYSGNNLGWGIDWAAICTARARNLIIVRDQNQKVSHPPGRGYSSAEATQGMKVFLAQLSEDMQSTFRSLHSKFQHSKKPVVNTLESPELRDSFFRNIKYVEDFMSIKKSFQKSKTPISDVFVSSGNVYVRAGRTNIEASLSLQCGSKDIPFTALSQAPSISDIPYAFPLKAMPTDTSYHQLNDLGDWQVEEWRTLRVIPDYHHQAAQIHLGGHLEIPGGAGGLAFRADIACHRAQGDLVLVITDTDGEPLTEMRVPFSPETSGGNAPDGYQSVLMNIPGAERPRHLSMRLDSRRARASTENDPAVFFIARPRIDTALANQNVAAISLSLDDTQGTNWYHAVAPTGLLCAKNGLELVSGKARLQLLPPQQPGVYLEKDWGHVLNFHTNDPIKTVVWLNGQAGFAFQMHPGQNTLRLPAKHLTGQPVLMDLRDPSGTQVFWKNWALPRRQVTEVPTLQSESHGPFSSDLFPQSPSRFGSLRQHLTAARPNTDLNQISRTIDMLEEGYANVKPQPLVFPKEKKPKVSIVIPAHNKASVTYSCLAALLLAWNKATFEVILVDDASTDETAEIEDMVKGITVVRNTEAQRFIRACNAGAAKARGEYVVLLNNDTEPTSGWLDSLIDAFERFPNVGLAGSKLLYPDGSLQDAGGIIWGTGDPWNYGNKQNPWEPRFSYSRQADYLSGAAMMTTKKIWDELDGLSAYLEPMYFEDTDFAFKVRDAGYTTWFVPSSVVYHYEGMTSGTSTSSGFKRFQEVNRPKFKRQWAKAFKEFSKPGTQPDLEKDRGITGRVLFIDYTTPTPDQSAGSYAALEEIKLVQSLGYKVTFLPENLAYMGNYTHELEKMGVEMIISPFYQSIDEFLNARGGEFDAFYITRYHVVNEMVPQIRAVNPEAPVIMNNADLHYLRMLRKAVAENDETQLEAARDVRELELAAMRSVDLVLSYNDKEHAVIEAQSEGMVKVMTCPWVLNTPDTIPPREGRQGLSFLGGFQHHPNVEGVEWFAKSVMQELGSSRPDLHLSLYGSRMGADVKALEADNITPVGFIEDPAVSYDNHLVFVAPLLSGAGIKGKVLGALAHGIPCVLSPMAAEGIGLRHGLDAMIADTPLEWVTAITQVHDDPELWEKLSQNGHALAKTQFSFEGGKEKMRAAFEAIGLFAHHT
jgi:GT2 family glycosyltransferase/glycosyltransferase involved in cell wall biosynthesis